MSIRDRLLDSVSSFADAVKTNTLETFNSTFADLSNDIRTAKAQGSLASQDEDLAGIVSRQIEALAKSVEELDSALVVNAASLESEIAVRLDEDNCSAACAQPHTHSTSDVPFQRSPTPSSPPLAIVPLHRPSHSNDSGSNDDSDSEESPQTRKKTGPENPAVFRHLRDWFLAHFEHPFPTSSEKKQLAAARRLELNSINLWFTNMRRRSGWTAAQTKFASSDPDLMRALIKKHNDPEKQLSLPKEVREELTRIRDYIDERGQERIRDYMVAVIEKGLEAGRAVPEEEWDDEEEPERDEEESEDEPTELKVYQGGWQEVGNTSSSKRRSRDVEVDFEGLGIGREPKRGRGEVGSFPSSSQADALRKSSNHSTATSASLPYSDTPTTPLSSFGDRQSLSPVEPEESPYLYPVATQEPHHLSQTSRPVAPLRRHTSSSRGHPESLSTREAWSSSSRYQQQPYGRSTSGSSSLRVISGGSASTTGSMGYLPEEADYGHQISPTRRDQGSYGRRDHQPCYSGPPPASHPRHYDDHAPSSSSAHYDRDEQPYYTSSSSSSRATYSTPSHSRPYPSSQRYDHPPTSPDRRLLPPHSHQPYHDPHPAHSYQYSSSSERHQPPPAASTYHEAPLPSISRTRGVPAYLPPLSTHSSHRPENHSSAPEGFSDAHASFGDERSSRSERRVSKAGERRGSDQ